MASLRKAQRPAIGDLKMFVGSDDELTRQLRLGWAVADGTSGTVNFIDKFPKFDGAVNRGAAGGSKVITPAGSVAVSVSNHTLSASQMPNHGHSYTAAGSKNLGSAGTTGAQPVNGTTGGAGSSGAHNHGGSGTFTGSEQSNEPQFINTLPLQFIGRAA